MTVSLTARLSLAIVAVLSILVALASARYVLPDAPSVPPEVAANLFFRPWLAIHALLAIVALIIGPFQFIRGRRTIRPSWHRLAGRFYVAGCLASAPMGLVLAMGTWAGPVAAVGFGLLAVLWFVTTALGFKAALDRRFVDHRRWMVRSFALTFAAVTLRLYLPIGPLFGIEFVEAYRVISFISWVPNLIIAELIIRAPSRRTAPA